MGAFNLKTSLAASCNKDCRSLESMLTGGLALVPIPLGQKGPTSTGWNERANVVTNPLDAHKLEGLNVGLAHAYCSPTATSAIDVDDYPDAAEWLGGRGINLEGLCADPAAVRATSQREGRLKLFYRLPQGVGPVEGFKVRSAAGKNILEFRCGTKGGKTEQDVLPPSIHPETGKPYIWVGDSDPTRIPDIPPDLLALWQAELVTRTLRTGTHCLSGFVGYPNHPETPAEVARLLDRLSFISADCDYETYRNVVWAILGTGWSCAEDLARKWCETAPDRFEEDDFYNVVNSFDPERDPRPTMGTIFHLARKGGWNG